MREPDDRVNAFLAPVMKRLEEHEARPLEACRHLLDANGLAMTLCALHPHVGLLCASECAREHVARHPLDGACTSCGAVGPVHAGASSVYVPALSVLHPAGGVEVSLAGTVHVLGVYLCDSCARRSRVASS